MALRFMLSFVLLMVVAGCADKEELIISGKDQKAFDISMEYAMATLDEKDAKVLAANYKYITDEYERDMQVMSNGPLYTRERLMFNLNGRKPSEINQVADNLRNLPRLDATRLNARNKGPFLNSLNVLKQDAADIEQFEKDFIAAFDHWLPTYGGSFRHQPDIASIFYFRYMNGRTFPEVTSLLEHLKTLTP